MTNDMRKLFFIACMFLTALLMSSCVETRKETFICDVTYTLDNYGDYVVIEETDTVQVTYNHRWYALYLKYIECPHDGEKKLMISTGNYISNNTNDKQVCVTSLPIVCYSMHVHKLK